MGDVTAVNMDVVTESSGHAFTPMAVSVCLTPAAPSPLPIPYPVTSTSTQGVTDPAMRTKIDGAKVITVGSVFTVCHGNEPGTLKEVVSLNTSGPCFIVMGAPTVICELGFMGITNSPGFLNKQVTVGAPGMASGAGGAGAGGGGGDGGGGGGGDGDKKSDSNSGSGGSSSSSAASGPSPEEKKLAAEANANPDDGKNADRVAARKKVANDFYQKNGEKYDPKVKGNRKFKLPDEQAEINSHLKGIDYDKPVTSGPPPPMPDTLTQYHVPDRKGQYFGPAGQTPSECGIRGNGVDPNTKKFCTKKNDTYEMDPNQPYLKSTAAPVKDDWSIKNNPADCSGGGTQYYVPDQNNGAKNVTGSP